MSEFPHLKKMKIFQRQLPGEALKSNSIAKRIRISADPSIIYCPSPSGLAKKVKESWKKWPQITIAKNALALYL